MISHKATKPTKAMPTGPLTVEELTPAIVEKYRRSLEQALASMKYLRQAYDRPGMSIEAIRMHNAQGLDAHLPGHIKRAIKKELRGAA